MAEKHASEKAHPHRVFGQARKPPKMFRASLYARVSTDDQQTGARRILGNQAAVRFLRRSRKSSKRGRGDWESAEVLESRQDTRRCPVQGNRVQSPETPRRSGNHERRHSQQSQAASGVAQRSDRVDRRRPPSGYEACQQGRCKQHRRSSHIRNPIERAHSVQQGARQPRCLDG